MQHEGVEKTVELPVGKVVPLELATVLGLICERREALPQQVVDLVFSEGVLASVSIAAARHIELGLELLLPLVPLVPVPAHDDMAQLSSLQVYRLVVDLGGLLLLLHLLGQPTSSEDRLSVSPEIVDCMNQRGLLATHLLVLESVMLHDVINLIPGELLSNNEGQPLD